MAGMALVWAATGHLTSAGERRNSGRPIQAVARGTLRNRRQPVLIGLGLMLMAMLPARLAAAAPLDDLLRQNPVVVAGTMLDGPALRRFYALRGDKPAWTIAQAEQLRQILDRVGEDGLDPATYHLAALTSALQKVAVAGHPTDPLAVIGVKASRPTAEQVKGQTDLATLDLLASDAALRYAADLGQGQVVPSQVDANWGITPPSVDPVAVLNAAVVPGASLPVVLDALAPHQPGYLRLKQALASYRGLARADGWMRIDDGPTLKPGMSDPRVVQLRARLGLPDDESGSNAVFDDAVTAAVREFQQRQGLDDDGTVGQSTLRALNQTVAERINTLKANLERWRWLPRDFGAAGATFIEVNISAQQLDVYEHGDRQIAMRTVVGAAGKATPLMNTRITTAIFAPSWRIPSKISAGEILPKLQRDPNYLRENDMRIIGLPEEAATGAGIDWRRYGAANFPYALMQLPGDKNALGHVKFVIPNTSDIYLHDTPVRKLFATYARAQSHGCVRLEKPAELAVWLLRDQPGWDAARVGVELARSDTQAVAVRKPVPLYLVYFTAWVEADGSVQFRNDIYGWDAKLLRALRQRAHTPLTPAPAEAPPRS